MSKPTHGYQELHQEQIDDPDGARAVFSRRNGSPPIHTVAFFKHYKGPDDNPAHTSFFTRKTLESLRRVLDLADKKLAELDAAAEIERQNAPTQSANRR